jgi:DNA replication and repair protein RecF
LALKLAEIHWMAAETGDNPILLLDEVVAELDEERRELLLNVVKDSSQAILTATDPTMFSQAFLGKATSMTVKAGQVSPDDKTG